MWVYSYRTDTEQPRNGQGADMEQIWNRIRLMSDTYKRKAAAASKPNQPVRVPVVGDYVNLEEGNAPRLGKHGYAKRTPAPSSSLPSCSAALGDSFWLWNENWPLHTRPTTIK